MPTLRAEQLAALEAYASDQFAHLLGRSLVALLAPAYGPLQVDTLLPRLRSAIEAANHYGLSDQNSVAKYVFLAVCLGERFETRPPFEWAKSVLLGCASSDLATRMDEVFARLLSAQ